MTDTQGSKDPDGLVRVNKRDFIRKMAAEADLPLNVTAVAYEAFVKTLLDQVRAGAQVNLTGFGRFYWQQHKGHRVQFAKSEGGMVDDYTVLKFSATRESNDFLARGDHEIADMRVPGTRIRHSGQQTPVPEDPDDTQTPELEEPS